MNRLGAALAASALLLAAGSVRAEVSVANAWMRPAAEGAARADAYADLRTDAPATLVAVRTPAARRVDIVVHDPRDPATVPHVVEKLEMPRGETRFALKGSVLRLVDVTTAIAPGHPVRLVFELVDAAGHASKVETTVEVRGFVVPPATKR